MKKALVLITLLSVLLAGGMAFVFSDVDSARDRVTITEVPVFGDAAAANGLEVLVRTHYDRRLFWDTVYRTGFSSAQTAFLFSQARLKETPPREYGGVLLDTGIEYGFDMSPEGGQSGLAAAYRELFDRTPAGSKGKATVRLGDYYDCYPIRGTVDVPGYTLGWGAGFSADMEPEPGTEAYIILAFQDFFQIPVLEEETVDIFVTKNADGSMGGYGGGSTESDAFYIQTLSALTDDMCFFAFDAHTIKGNVADTSLIPGGYGIYGLPYEKDGVVRDGQKLPGILIDELSMVYPLNPADTVCALYLNPDQTKLLLLAIENDVCVLTVIDAESMQTLQRLELGTLAPDGDVWNTYYYGDFMAVWMAEDQLSLVEAGEGGEYRHCFTVQAAGGKDGLFRLGTNAVMDWDGEKLVISDFLSNTHDKEKHFQSCGFYLTVYDETGLLYYGEYLSSLDAGSQMYNRGGVCQRIQYSPLTVGWKK